MAQTRLWYLDNEHSDYVIVAETELEAWTKLTAATGIQPFGSAHVLQGEDDVAYHALFEITDGTTVDNPNDVTFIL